MVEAGQQALVDFVAAGGGFLHQEWNAYTHDEALKYQLLADLTLLVRGSAGDVGTWTVVPGREGHPVVAGGSIAVSGIGNYGLARVYETDPSVVLMTMAGYDAVVAREWHEGRIVGMAVAGTYAGQDPYSPEFLGLINDSAAWLGECDRDGDGHEREFCGGDDCDDDDAMALGPATFYADVDGDGYGGVAETFCESPGEGWSEVDGDCDDNDAAAFPGAAEEPYDGVDQDCDGADLCDVDGDGADADACGGEDCDDEDDTIGPDAPVQMDDGIDQNCDGVDEVTPTADDTGEPADGDGKGDAPAAGCGCDSGGGAAGVGAGLLAAGLLLRRRRV